MTSTIDDSTIGTGNGAFERDLDGESDHVGPDPLFSGDTGQLTPDVRNVLVALLKKRYISSDRHAKEWQIVLANEAALRTRLNDLYLDLIIDRGYEVAYKRQATPEGGNRFPTVLHDLAYSREETILLVHLRRLIRTGQQAGEDAVFVDKVALTEEIGHYQPASTTNHVAAAKAAENAVASMVRSDILLKTAEPDRYRVAPIIEVLLPVDRIKELLGWLRGETPGTGEADTGADADADAGADAGAGAGADADTGAGAGAGAGSEADVDADGEDDR